MRARGANALLGGGIEGVYGTPPSDLIRLPFVSSNLGEERPLLESDLLGLGRETLDPTPDVATNDGDVVVPVDTVLIGWWLRLLLGTPVTTGGTGTYTHVFTSGALTLPSASLEVGHPDLGKYFMNIGAKANQMRIAMSRSGLLNATMALICQGELPAMNAPADAMETLIDFARFSQATGSIKKDGAVLADITAADLTLSNNLDKVETIRADGRIGGADEGMFMGSGSVTSRFGDTVLLDAATSGTPVGLEYGWQKGAASLKIAAPRVFLPRVKRPVSGPGGVQAQLNWQASGQAGHAITVTLVNGYDGAVYNA